MSSARPIELIGALLVLALIGWALWRSRDNLSLRDEARAGAGILSAADYFAFWRTQLIISGVLPLMAITCPLCVAITTQPAGSVPDL